MNELEVKLGRIRELLKAQSAEALLLQQVDSFAWATCGAPAFIDTAVRQGVGSLLITATGRYVITDNIEGQRLMQEYGLEAQGWELRTAPWYEAKHTVAELSKGLKLAADGAYPGAVDVSAYIPRMRAALTPEEDERFRALGKDCATAMNAVLHATKPGMTENQIAAVLASETVSRGIQPIVDLVATDERIFKYRHPLPTEKRLEKYAMVILCGRRSGLVCSLTRLVHFGALTDELRKKSQAAAKVDATFIAATRPGRKMNAIFQEAADCYEAVGYPGEWKLHHQGGLGGYSPREIVATPYTEEVVAVGQVYAWNPTITGTKTEDSILIGQDGNEILTAIPGWPTIKAEAGGKTWERPAILEVK